MPRVWIDLKAKDAAEKLRALMVWPDNAAAKADYLVTVGAIGKQAVKNLAPLNGAAVVAEIDELYLQPNGGDGRLAYARGVDLIRQDAMAAGGKFGAACGQILFTIAVLRTHHLEIGASKNRAMHIMICRAKREGRGRDIPADRDRKKMWESWGPVAPLWAAYFSWKAIAGEQKIPWDFRQWVTLIVSTSLWFANFAIGFKATGAAGKLLSEDAVIRVNPDMEPTEPALPRLSNRELAWARAYAANPLTKKK